MNVYLALGHADEVAGLERRHSLRECSGIGQTLNISSTLIHENLESPFLYLTWRKKENLLLFVAFNNAHDCLTYVLAGKAHKPARHVQRVLASLQHPAQPVEGSVFIRAPHWLMQGWDAVVVLLTWNSDTHHWWSAFFMYLLVLPSNMRTSLYSPF